MAEVTVVGDAEVAACFVLEAAEHLQAMRRALQALGRGGWDEAELGALFRATHTLKGTAYTAGCTPVGDLAHRLEDLLVALRERRLVPTGRVLDAAFAGIEALRLVLPGAGSASPELRGVLERATAGLEALLSEPPGPPAPAPPAARTPGATPSAAADPPGATAQDGSAPGGPGLTGAAPPRSPADQLEGLARRLAELAPDLGVVEGRLAGLEGELAEETDRLQRLPTSLPAELARARLVPIGTLLGRFARQARQGAHAAGKSIRVEVSGAGVAVDVALVERLVGPLLHLVQNAIAHGIEPEAERRARGKPVPATIALRAAHRGGAISVEVEDDGRGIDAGALRAAAVRRGWLTAEAAARLDRAGALELIFLPGLSTAPAVTALAGRGVGMDVVRTTVGRLGGAIAVASAPGVGTRVTLTLPVRPRDIGEPAAVAPVTPAGPGSGAAAPATRAGRGGPA